VPGTPSDCSCAIPVKLCGTPNCIHNI